VHQAALGLFSRVNGYSAFPPGLLARFRNCERPVLSCVLLLPFNDLFARNVILPSIIANTRLPLEIVVVFAGFGVDRTPFRHLLQVESEMTCITKGYNAGVRAARGEYVALFHDDCFLEDPEWLEKALAALEGGATAATPELDRWNVVPVMKSVPLVMRRDDYVRLGGFDEYYYAGVEDLDLTTTILSQGGEVAKLDLDYRHLRGMGSSLVVHEHPHQLKLLFGYQVLPPGTIAAVHADMMQRMLAHGFIRMLEGDYHLHYLDKHGDFLTRAFGLDLGLIRHAYQTRRYPYLLSPEIGYISNRPRLIEAFRAMMNEDELRRPVQPA
jgi:hypothetical protein